MNSGMINMALGMNWVHKSTSMNGCFPLNLNLDRAYPTSSALATVMRQATADTRRLLRKYWEKPTSLQAVT